MSTSSKRRACAQDAEIGFRIRQIRQNKKIAQKLIAEQCGISRQQLRRYELGIHRLTIPMLLKIAEKLEVDVHEIIQPVNSNRLPAALKSGALQNPDQLAATLWRKINCRRQKRVLIELMDLLQRCPPGHPESPERKE